MVKMHCNSIYACLSSLNLSKFQQYLFVLLVFRVVSRSLATYMYVSSSGTLSIGFLCPSVPVSNCTSYAQLSCWGRSSYIKTFCASFSSLSGRSTLRSAAMDLPVVSRMRWPLPNLEALLMLGPLVGTAFPSLSLPFPLSRNA